LLDTGWCTEYLWFQGAQPDHLRAESSSCCFPKNFVIFHTFELGGIDLS